MAVFWVYWSVVATAVVWCLGELGVNWWQEHGRHRRRRVRRARAIRPIYSGLVITLCGCWLLAFRWT